MPGAVRFSVSLPEDLLEHFDVLLKEKGYSNRSEGIRDLIRDRLVKEEVETGQEVVGVVTLVYDHHVRELSETLIEEQHKSHSDVISSMHVHLDHHHCLEVIITRGSYQTLRTFADRLIGTRGVKHGDLVITTTGVHVP